ncbi:MAG: ABC transporter substrate-binding protein, partial [Firmicutes bacterium]|nr:ABC transporter substrate-binding protein [Bacillota bacterium]
PGGSSTRMIEPLFDAVGVDKSKVEIVATSPKVAPTLLIDKKIDAFTTWCFTMASIIKSQGFEPNCVYFADYGFNVLGQGIIANTFYIQQNPEVIRGVVKASIRGFQEAQKDIEGAVKAAKAHCEECDEAIIRENLTDASSMYHSKRTQGWIPGKASPEDWEESKKILVEFSGLDDRIPSEAYYDYSFMPQ